MPMLDDQDDNAEEPPLSPSKLAKTATSVASLAIAARMMREAESRGIVRCVALDSVGDNRECVYVLALMVFLCMFFSRFYDS